MDLKELDRQAKQGLVMPNGLKGYEQAYYIASRGLYRQYKEGKISLDEARKEKEQVLQMYKQCQEEWFYVMKLHHIESKLRLLQAEGFNTVLELEILELLKEL